MQTAFSRKASKSLRPLVEAGVMIALAQLLSYIKFFEMPLGGSITPASMLPILFFAVRWGTRWGLGAGVTYGLLQFLLGTKWPSPVFAGTPVLAYGLVLILDYLVAFGALGLAGLFKGFSWRLRLYKEADGNIEKSHEIHLALPLGILLGTCARFAAHFVSGLILWSASWIYSLSYNGAYMSVETAICLILALAVSGPLKKYIEGRDIPAGA